MRAEYRSALATVVNLLQRAGFQAAIPTGRAKRRGFKARFLFGGVVPAVYLFSDHCDEDEFSRHIAAVRAAGYTVTDSKGTDNMVRFGCARLTPPTGAR